MLTTPLEAIVFTALAVQATLVVAGIRERINQLRRAPDTGEGITQTTIIVALFAAASITIVGIIVGKIIARANSINLGP